MAKHKAATEITIAQEERSAFADVVDQYKWIGIGIIAAISAVVLWSNRSSNQAVATNRGDWEELWSAGRADEPAEAFLQASSEITSAPVASLAHMNRALALASDRKYEDANQAVGQAKDAPALFTEVAFPVEQDGESKPLLSQLRESLDREKEWMDGHRELFENPALPADAPKVKFETTEGDIVLGLYIDKAPLHAKNLLTLVEEGYYDGIRFHRIKPGQFIQGGDPLSREDDWQKWGTGGPEKKISREESGLVHAEGALSAAKQSGAVDSSGSQFFITASPMHMFDGDYVVYGTVIEGLELVQKISEGATREENAELALDPVTINKATIL